MLVLSRKQTESVVLPDLGITIRVLKVAGNRVQIGIDAPKEVRVLRGELCEWEVENDQHSGSPLEHSAA